MPDLSRPSLHPAQRPPRSVTRERFLEWRSPRVGAANPERLTNPMWAWLARHPDLNAYMANLHFGGPSSMAAGPCWCANRFGQSTTALPDGRVVRIAGEHEDYYDPDFCIYNDVVVVGPSGNIDVYGYPHAAFPPTDFHSATLVGDRVVLLGSLGYPSQRAPGVTPAFVLDTDTLAINPFALGGDAPGWIFRHRAELSDDRNTITVRGGERVELIDDAQEIRESIDDWSLDLERRVWTRLTERRWPLWELTRADGSPNHLMTIGWMSWHVGGAKLFDRTQLATLGAELGWTPDFDVFAARYAPPFAHDRLPESDDAPATRIVVDGVTVRYVEGSSSVRITVEGALAPAAIEALVEDARGKLSTLERSPWVARALRG